MKPLHFIFAAAVAFFPVTGWAEGDGAAAFAERDFATARSIWQNEADNGVADAMLGLGLLADRGFGQPRDQNAAFTWYLQAAELGLQEAQFNVAIMLDAGIGRERDARQAQIWYTRAALRGHARAQYNLGLLFESGDGIMPNEGLARYWFEKAALSVPAAADKSFAQPTSQGTLLPPEVLFGERGPSDIELVWTADPDTTGTFIVESVPVPTGNENYLQPELSLTTTASGLIDDTLEQSAQTTILRVSSLADDSSDYAASAWISSDGVTPPNGRITLLHDPDIAAMVSASEVFAATLRNAGFWVKIDDTPRTDLAPYYVSYGYASDNEFAQAVAQFLPSIDGTLDVTQVLQATQPGEVVVNLSAFR